VTSYLLDTHAWAWSLSNDARLSQHALLSLQSAAQVYVSPISLFEIGQKVRIGKWPEMEQHLDRLPSLIEAQGAKVAKLTPDICLDASMLEWRHRDPFDRLLAATALHMGSKLISADDAFDALLEKREWPGRVW
jgi:PIN domain nuclease of toxin-antitoxin system